MFLQLTKRAIVIMLVFVILPILLIYPLYVSSENAGRNIGRGDESTIQDGNGDFVIPEINNYLKYINPYTNDIDREVFSTNYTSDLSYLNSGDVEVTYGYHENKIYIGITNLEDETTYDFYYEYFV